MIESSTALKVLPLLRRHARAIVGDQQRADAVVLAVVQSFSEDGTNLSDLDRVDFYRRFTAIWTGPVGQHILQTSSGASQQVAFERNLSALPAWERHAFLLSGVEGFSNDEVAEILQIPRAIVPALLTSARAAISKQMATTVVIIEDELFIAADLEDIITSLGHTVLAIERTRTSAVRAIKEKRPGLVLADVQLADGSSGIEAINDIVGDMEIPVIFISAYPERFLTGQRLEPTFVLRKPFKTESVRAAVSQALFFDFKAYRARTAPQRTPMHSDMQ